MIDPGQVRARLDAVHGRIQAAGGGAGVTVVAVTKGFGVDAIEAALAAGLVDVGENYAQELSDKVAELVVPVGAPPPRIHFIGRLQRNKVRHLAGTVAVWQSVDRSELVREIAARAPGATVLVQLNLSGEPQKGGCAPADAPALVQQARELGLDVQGSWVSARPGPPTPRGPGSASWSRWPTSSTCRSARSA